MKTESHVSKQYNSYFIPESCVSDLFSRRAMSPKAPSTIEKIVLFTFPCWPEDYDCTSAAAAAFENFGVQYVLLACSEPLTYALIFYILIPGLPTMPIYESQFR